ncbi:uncharacterized protein LOC126590311 isoform X1 [Malus sylvestris]|uniref:uncharacterized protein LOC126590311 isoform X1 n=1 Tax=Malus sylvestris TaxID=3752 RepID=UPI0021AC674A|nr:uncharacterized protein LOC126590311 isoform X1 [Malus sylvestris]
MENQGSSICFHRFLGLRIASIRMKICCLREEIFNLEKLGFQEIVNPGSFILSSSPTMVPDPLGIKDVFNDLKNSAALHEHLLIIEHGFMIKLFKRIARERAGGGGLYSRCI